MPTVITPFKLARYPELLTDAVKPIHWDIDPSSVCDHRCKGCPYIFDGPTDPMLGVARPEVTPDKRTFLDFMRLISFMDEAKACGCKAVTFVGGGEPTLHPNIGPILYAAAERFKFGIVTHLGLKYHEMTLKAMGLATWIRVSVNAGARSTYEAHQGKDCFERVQDNTEALCENGGPRVGWSFLVTSDNYHEIPKAAYLAKELGCAYIQFKPLVAPDMCKVYEGLIDEDILDQLKGAKEFASPDFQVIDQWQPRLNELRSHEAGKFSGKCWVPRFNPKLGANGMVYTCCELAYSNEGALGDIYKEPLASILEKAGSCNMEMSKCPQCWDKPLNTLINEGRVSEIPMPPESVDQEFV